MFDVWIKGWRRRRLIRKPTPETWVPILDANFWYWKILTSAQRERLLKLIRIFLHEKEVVVPRQIADTETARVTVAAAACQMLLGFDDWYCFDQVHTVILTENPIVVPVRHSSVDVLFGDMVAAGLYQRGAPVVICWPDAAEECANSDFTSNVVIHEFAHHIDDLDGALAGDPPFSSQRSSARWKQVLRKDMDNLLRQVDLQESTVLDEYGLTNEAEFFAVSCESFFYQPLELARAHRDLYELLKLLFRQDPAIGFANAGFDSGSSIG